MINKTILCIALGSACVITTTSAEAALPGDAILNISPFVLGGYYGNLVVDGSYFAMDNDGNGIFAKNERVGLSAGTDGGIALGTTQGAGAIDEPWSFFSATGNHTQAGTLSVATTSGNSATINMTGWNVFWNGGNIDMGTGADATVTCGVDCSAGDTYALDYTAVVPSGGFAGVHYALHLTGTITLPLATNDAPVAKDDAVTVDRKATGRPYVSSVIDILFNDTDANGTSDIDRTTVVTTPVGAGTAGGTFVVDSTTGNITYTPPNDFLGTDTFTYVVSDKGGPTAGSATPVIKTSTVATVTITVQNALPVANDDSASLDTSSAASVNIDVLNNDTDSDGSVVNATVTIDPANPPAHGSTSINQLTGAVTYTPNAGYIGTDTFKYTVEDNDMAVSNLATVVVVVSSGTGILPANAFLIINAGTGVPGEGSYFTMEVSPGKLTSVGLTGFDHIHLGTIQLGSAAMPNIDEPWQFFGNFGIHQTTAPITILTDDGNGNVTLDFKGWNVSWNSIASIPLPNGDDNGIATLTCAVDCSIDDTFSLIYRATVPPGDPSGFGGVHYILHLDGKISDKAPTVGGGNISAPYRVNDVELIVAVDNSTSSSPNPVNITGGSIAVKAGKPTGTGLTANDVGNDPALNPKDGKQCIGGCIDFVATGVTTDFVDLVFKLSEPIPDGAIFRKLIHGKWTGFSTAGVDQEGTANADASGNCQGPEGKYNTGLRKGATCVFLRLYDGGANDADGVKNGTIVDPSGVLLAGSSNVPPPSTSGCSISATPVAIQDRADWLIVAAFISLLGLLRIKRKSHD